MEREVKESTLPASEFKAKCLRLLDDVAQHGSSLIITKGGRPIARVGPVPQPNQTLKGTWKGVLEGTADIVQFDVSAEWESNR